MAPALHAGIRRFESYWEHLGCGGLVAPATLIRLLCWVQFPGILMLKKNLIILSLFLCACINLPLIDINSEIQPADPCNLAYIAYNSSNNAILCKKLLAKIDSNNISIQDIRFFILAEQHAWQETASNIANLDSRR